MKDAIRRMRSRESWLFRSQLASRSAPVVIDSPRSRLPSWSTPSRSTPSRSTATKSKNPEAHCCTSGFSSHRGFLLAALGHRERPLYAATRLRLEAAVAVACGVAAYSRASCSQPDWLRTRAKKRA